MTGNGFWLVVLFSGLGCREARPPRSSGMAPPETVVVLRSTDLAQYRAAVEAELVALRAAEARGIRLTQSTLDSAGASGSGREAARLALLERRVTGYLRQWSAADGVPDVELQLLDSLRSELVVMKVRAGP